MEAAANLLACADAAFVREAHRVHTDGFNQNI